MQNERVRFELRVFDDTSDEEIFLGEYYSAETLVEKLYQAETAIKIYRQELLEDVYGS